MDEALRGLTWSVRSELRRPQADFSIERFGLCPPVEADAAGGVSGRLVRRIVGSGMVSWAEESAVFEVGVAAIGPADPVVGVGLPPIARTPSQWSSGHGEVFA